MISIEEIKKAREVIQDTVAHTPVVELELPDLKTNIFFKISPSNNFNITSLSS